MKEIGAYGYIIAICLLVILSYLFNLISRRTGIPSVLLLLLTGIGVRETLVFNNISVEVSPQMVEIFGILGLIMIILEAGLDLQLGKKKIKLIRNAFFSGLIILVLSSIAISSFLYFYLKEDFV